ncbi:MAG: DNA polymerase III subunit alpha [Actinomycetota bacterium]
MFSHLHVHSEYSLLESSIKIDNLIESATQYSMDAVALTDKYVMHGAVEFYKKAVQKNIKPIIGSEICIRDKGRLFYLVLLAKNIEGYSSLCKIVSSSHLEKKTAIPSVSLSLLKSSCNALIALSPDRSGQVSEFLRENRVRKAQHAIEEYKEIFGQDFYIEIQRYPFGKNTGSSISEPLVNLSRKTSTPIVATNNVHYLSEKDYNIYRHLIKLKLMGTKKDPTLKLLPGSQNYFKSVKEMESMFEDIPDALKNSQKIAAKCDLKLRLGNIGVPDFKVPEGSSQPGYLRKLCYRKISKRYNSPDSRILKRLEDELSIIEKTGYSGYFLIVADIASFARKNHIPICGKGSAAGSLVSYVLGISNVDPVENNLYFERFLNEERQEPPDIDIDIANKKRDKILSYLRLKYGKKNTGRVCLFSTIKPRSSVRETARMLNYSKQEIDQLIASGDRKDGNESGYMQLFSTSSKLEGYPRHVSMHPTAVIVSNSSLDSSIPLMLSETKEAMSQYDMKSIEDLGILKIDLINSLSLTLIDEVKDRLKKRGISLDLPGLGHRDPRIFDMIKKGKTLGVFQLESTGIRALMRKIKPSSIKDIILLVSLYRPGPQQSGMVGNFIERKFEREKISYIHKDLKPLLEDTFGIMLYQEQVLQIARKIAGYTFGEADNLRKAITKRSKHKMAMQKKRFIAGGIKKGYHKRKLEDIFNLISKFASYGFVKAHAAAYADLSYKTCYLKAYFPAEFFAVMLSNNSGYYMPEQYIEEARRMGINIKGPHINSNCFFFEVEDAGRSIRVPLICVKGVGNTFARYIKNERDRKGRFRNFAGFYNRIYKKYRVTKTAVENLIKAGAFDFTGRGRKCLMMDFFSFQNRKDTRTNAKLGDFSFEEKLKAEKEILGFCVRSNPLSYYRQELKNLSITPSKDFLLLSKGKDGHRYTRLKPVTCIGTVINVNKKKTRDGSFMAFCTLEDRHGMYETVFFPGPYKDNKNIIIQGSPILVKGKLHYRDSNISLIVNKAVGLETLKRVRGQKKSDLIKNQLLKEMMPLW